MELNNSLSNVYKSLLKTRMDKIFKLKFIQFLTVNIFFHSQILLKLEQ